METKKIIVIFVIVLMIISAVYFFFFLPKEGATTPVEDLRSAIVVSKFKDYGQHHLVVRYKMKYLVMPVKKAVFEHQNLGDTLAVYDDGN